MIEGVKNGDRVDLRLWVHLKKSSYFDIAEKNLRKIGFSSFQRDEYTDITPINQNFPNERSLLKCRGFSFEYSNKKHNDLDVKLREATNEYSFEIWPYYTSEAAEKRVNVKNHLVKIIAAVVILSVAAIVGLKSL